MSLNFVDMKNRFLIKKFLNYKFDYKVKVITNSL